jgi:hypothetical protein
MQRVEILTGAIVTPLVSVLATMKGKKILSASSIKDYLLRGRRVRQHPQNGDCELQ